MGLRGEGRLFRPRYVDRHGERKSSAVWWWAISIHGQKRRLNTHCTDHKAARDWVVDRLAEMHHGNMSALTAGRVTLQQLEDLVCDDYTANGRSTVRLVRIRYTHLRRLLGNPLAASITDAQLVAYRARRLEEGAARATVNMEFTVLRRGYSLARKLLPPPPAMPYLKLDNARKGFFERGAFDAMLGYLAPELRGALTAAYITGWRLRSELLTRQWRHVDFAAGWLRIEPGEDKNRAGRMFPLLPELREVLEGQRAYTDGIERERGAVIPWVFHREGRPIRNLERAWAAARLKAGLPNALKHDLRRTAVRNLERAHVERSAAMKMVGMKTESIWRRYAIVDEAQLAEAGEKLSALLASQRGKAKVSPLRRG